MENRGKDRRGSYLTHNVIIVSQSTGMGEVSRGVTQFPYICLRALCDGGQREVIDVLLRLWAALTKRQREREQEIIKWIDQLNGSLILGDITINDAIKCFW